MPAIVKQTTKQAKAAYKARGRPTLSDQQLRQIQRAAELDERAEKLKEAERRRAEAAKKKAEQDKKDDEQSRLGTQRRYDRFGIKGSQFHLGAFFGKKDDQTAKSKAEKSGRQPGQNAGQDMFGDDDIDDEALLQAMNSPIVLHDTSHWLALPKAQTFGGEENAKPVTETSRSLQRARSTPGPVQPDDLSSFWDELGSSTQIARELDEPDETQKAGRTSRTSSFSSGEFDLTAEDLAELDVSRQPISKTGKLSTTETTAQPIPKFDRTINIALPDDLAYLRKKTPPPPALPTAEDIRRQEAARLMPPPPIPPRQLKIRIDPKQLRDVNPTPVSQPTRSTATQIRSNKRASTGNMLPPAVSLMRKTATPVDPPRRTHSLRIGQPQVKSGSAKWRPYNDFPRTFQASPAPSPRTTSTKSTKSSPSTTQGKPPNAIRGPFQPASSLHCSPNLGFTFSQLESFVDDDIQLSQPAPG